MKKVLLKKIIKELTIYNNKKDYDTIDKVAMDKPKRLMRKQEIRNEE